MRARCAPCLLWVLSAALGCSSSGSGHHGPAVTASPTAATATASAATVGSAVPRPPLRAMPIGRAEPPRVALGVTGAVASQEANATDIGLAVLQQGGNAVDAAVAVSFALAVTWPAAGNVGGGGFMVVHMRASGSEALDYRETAPALAHAEMYLDQAGNPTQDSLVGARAAGIPGSVAGLAAAHERFGKAPWRSLLAPAVRLAREGFVLDDVAAESLAAARSEMQRNGFAASARVYSRPDGRALAAGDRLTMPALGATLESVANEGPRAFYEGPLAERMVDEVRAAGGLWGAEDLARYRPVWRAPVVFDYRGHQIVGMPPPSSGGIVLRQLLGASELLRMNEAPWRGADELHLFVEAARRAYADRNQLLGDPELVAVPTATLLDPAYLARRMADVDRTRATASSGVRPGLDPATVVPTAPREAMETTHLSVVDAEGNAVACTTTLNGGFGALYVLPSSGVLLNDEMDDFAAKPGSPNTYGLVQGVANAIAPGKRMLSSMTPTIVLRDGELRAVLGSPGGPTITTTVAQVVRALLDYGRPLDEAIPAFRAHHQWLPDEVVAESTMPASVEAELRRRGHAVRRRARFGHVNAIEIDPATGGLRAVADTTRGGGKAAAY